MTSAKQAMPVAEVAEVLGSREEREAIGRFLASQPGGIKAGAWAKEAACWWDANPAYGAEDPKGWVLRHQDRVVGFLGAIVFDYTANGPVKALGASSWFVDARFRRQSLQLFNRFFALRQDYILLNTTPNDAVRAVLKTYRFQHEDTFQRTFYLVRQPWLGSRGWLNAPALAANRNLPRETAEYHCSLDGLSESKCVVPQGVVARSDGLEALRWGLGLEGAAPKLFASRRDGHALTAYMVLREETVKGLPGLSCIQLGYASRGELFRLVASVCNDPEPLGLSHRPCFLTLNLYAVQRDAVGIRTVAGLTRTGHSPHYYYLPRSLGDMPKLCMLGEGDYARFG